VLTTGCGNYIGVMIAIENITETSHSLRRNELKPLLVRQMKQERPEFRFLTFATGVYYFQRKREFRDYELKEMFHLVYSFADHTMQASVSSRLNPVHTLNPIYNNGLINPHIDLKALKNHLTLTVDNTPYSCDGRIDGVRDMVRTVVDDFTNVAIAYFDRRFIDLQSNRLISAGLDFIKDWDFDKTMLGNELQLQLRKAKFNVSRLRHPLINQFKHQLEAAGARSREVRETTLVPDATLAQQEIAQLAFDLAELYCNRRIAAY
jgi:hypothetical protein